jgi:hypothetical protein
VPGASVQISADIGVIADTPICWVNTRRPTPTTAPPTNARTGPPPRIAARAISTPTPRTTIAAMPSGVPHAGRPTTLTQPLALHASVWTTTSYVPTATWL